MEKDLKGYKMNRNLKHILFVLLSLNLFMCPSSGVPSETGVETETELARVIEKVKEKERTLKTFVAKFVQTEQTYLLHEPLHSEGLIYFDSSGKMLWKVTSPSPLVVLLKNNVLLICDPDLSKCEEKRLPRRDNILRKYFGIGQSASELKKDYEIQLIPETGSQDYHLKLIPKRKAIAKHIDTIEVVIDSKHWLPERIHIKEVKGDETSVSLQFTSVNEPLPPGIFTIDYPRDRKDGEDLPYDH
jgi:outer membrane lipoprotein-sorting protein